MKIAIAQLNPTVGHLTHNAQQILVAAQQAAAQSVRLLVTPELALCGYPPRDLLMQPSFVAAIAAQLNTLAASLPPELAVLVGTVTVNAAAAQQGEKPLHNSAALLQYGRVQEFFHKQLLPTYDVFDEARYFEPGQPTNVLTLDGVRIGVSICEDLWNDAEFWGQRRYEIDPMAALISAGVELVVNLSASPYTVTKPALRVAMLQHAARRAGCPCIYVNQVGGNDDLLFDGSSLAVDGTGQLVGRAQAFQPDLAMLTVNPATGTITSDRQVTPLAPDVAAIWSALVMGVRDYTQKCGFKAIVLGLSGGIDSALVAAIATAAVGAEQVLGVLMPSPYSSDHSVTDALALAHNLGIRTETIAIAAMMQAFDQQLAPLFTDTSFGVAEENLQSRIRGNLLMAIANKFGYLLLSTGNKSEMAVGYCTLYGDMNGGLAAIADVPKTLVYALCHWLNQSSVAHATQPLPEPIPLGFDQLQLGAALIPAVILTKPPSAELKPGQTDQDSLPDYDTLDAILARLIEQHQSPAEVIAAGYAPSTVNQVFHLWQRAEFKRRQAPPGLKITDRAFGTGWRMPIASHWSLPS